ncbi:MAG: sugar phosphate isomerase/epimerase family protein [Bryobacteraceae bacterium]
MTRRELMAAAAGCAPLLLSRKIAAVAEGAIAGLGGAPAAFGLEMRAARAADPHTDFLDLCHKIELDGCETRLVSYDVATARALRERAERYHMRIILDTPLPRDENDVERFDSAVKACKEAGAFSLHAAMTGRRYEEFDTFEAFHRDFERCQKSVALAEPVLRKYRLRLGIENHKGWRAAEQAAWLKRVSSEWVGVHFDFGNNISLCEDPEETFRILSPYAIACHLKDMAVEPYEDGFLLSEVPLGDGILDLARWVTALRQRDPQIPFDSETITRDPLKIPVFTKKYWATFDDSYSPLPGRDLARVLEIVHRNPPKKPLPRLSELSEEQRLRLEAENNRLSIRYARQTLRL